MVLWGNRRLNFRYHRNQEGSDVGSLKLRAIRKMQAVQWQAFITVAPVSRYRSARFASPDKPVTEYA